MNGHTYLNLAFVALSISLLLVQIYCVMFMVSRTYSIKEEYSQETTVSQSPPTEKITSNDRSPNLRQDKGTGDTNLSLELKIMLKEAKLAHKLELEQRQRDEKRLRNKFHMLQPNKTKTTHSNVFAEIPFDVLKYPLRVDMRALLAKLKFGRSIRTEQINMYHGKYIHAPWRKCEAVKDPLFVVFIIKSSAANFAVRNMIRQTWGNENLTSRLKFKRLFLIGNPENAEIQQRIDMEQFANRDLVEVSVNDSVRNSTMKTLRGLHWAVSFCSKSRYYLLLQDDTFVATEKLLQTLYGISKSLTLNYAGVVQTEKRPVRDKTSPMSVSKMEYRFDKYPDFVFGGAVLLSSNFSKDLLLAAKFTKIFSLDGVYIGIVAAKLGMTPQTVQNFEIQTIDFHDDRFRKVLVSHGYGNEHRLKSAWTAYRNILPPRKQASKATKQ